VTVRDVWTNRFFQELVGDGSEVQVSREGTVILTENIAKNLDIVSYEEIVDSDADKLISKLLHLLVKKLKYVKTIEAEKEQIKQELYKHTIDTSSADFEASKIKNLHDIITTSNNYETSNKRQREAGVEAKFGDKFTGKGNFKSSDEYNLAIKDTFSHDWTGEDYKTVPKTICVYQLNQASFESDEHISEVKIKPWIHKEVVLKECPSQIVTLAELHHSVPNPTTMDFAVGTVVAFCGKEIPARYLPCDGRTLSKKEYFKLYAVIGDVYGASDSTFTLPNLAGRTLVGAGSGAPLTSTRILGEFGGKEDHVLTIEEMPPHSHPFQRHAHNLVSNNLQWKSPPEGPRYEFPPENSVTAVVGGGQPHNNMPPFIVLHWIIRVY